VSADVPVHELDEASDALAQLVQGLQPPLLRVPLARLLAEPADVREDPLHHLRLEDHVGPGRGRRRGQHGAEQQGGA
jgi:hypothetical protein